MMKVVMCLRSLGVIAPIVLMFLSCGAWAAAILAPVPVREGVILLNLADPDRRDQPAVLFTPEGKELGRFAMGAAAKPLNRAGMPGCDLYEARLSPDGKRLAAFRLGRNNMPVAGAWIPTELWFFDLEQKKGPDEALKPNIRNPSLAWNAKGTKVFVSELDHEKSANPIAKGELAATVGWVYDFQNKRTAKLALPAGHEIVDVSPDEKFLLTRTRPEQQWETETAHVVALDTFLSRRLTVQPIQAMRISPDGKQVIGFRAVSKEGRPILPGTLVMVSVADGTERSIVLPTGALSAQHACWSPDGKRIAYEWTELGVDPAGPGKNQNLPEGLRPSPRVFRVAVADCDGTRARTIFQCESGQFIRGIDWR